MNLQTNLNTNQISSEPTEINQSTKPSISTNYTALSPKKRFKQNTETNEQCEQEVNENSFQYHPQNNAFKPYKKN